MDSNIGDMLKKVLDNPDALNKIMSMAGSMMDKSDEDNKERISEEPRKEGHEDKTHIDLPLHPKKIGSENSLKLVAAVKPYLSSERREAAEKILNIMKLMQVADLTKFLER